MAVKVKNKDAQSAHVKAHKKDYASGTLDPEVHYRLVQELSEVCRVSNVPRSYITQSSKGLCGKVELDWLVNYHDNIDNNIFGLVYIGVPDAHQRIMALSAALIRNFIDARIRTVQEVISFTKKGGQDAATVMAVPNFYRSKNSGGDIASWDVANLYGWLLQRVAEQTPTVLYVQSLQGLKSEYGDGIYDLVTNQMTQITT